ncbi:MAG: hypothetical protein A2Y38_22320 [Spirochaetes bacterium GWB1_59_5]|nr:MAG: hypothetical protein A2Y38_22320 [Spirochaetes bacterium GWB1_59_5]
MKPKTLFNTCSAVKLTGLGLLRHVTCHYRAKVERDGKWYCDRHDPVAKAEREAVARARIKADWEKWEQEQAAHRLEERKAEARLALYPMLIAELSMVVRVVGNSGIPDPTEAICLLKQADEIERMP